MVGLKAACADYVCVMDGDLQHPPEVVPVLLKTAIEQQADLVVATRRSDGSQVSGLSVARNLISHGLDLVARLFFLRRLHGVSDPLTGFFLVRVKALDLEALHPERLQDPDGDPRAESEACARRKCPSISAERFTGQSKASASEALKYLNLLWTLRFGEGSLRFIGFALVGVTGILVNSLFLFLATEKPAYLLPGFGRHRHGCIDIVELQPDRSNRLSGPQPGPGPCQAAGLVLRGERDCPGVAHPHDLPDDQHAWAFTM